MSQRESSDIVSGSQSNACLDHLALAIEAATNLKTQDILLPVGVAREILHKFQTYASPPPTPPPIHQRNCVCLKCMPPAFSLVG